MQQRGLKGLRRGWRRYKPRRRTLFLISVIAHVLGAIASMHAIMSARTSQGAIAWLFALNSMPYVALPAYLVLGEDEFEGYVQTHRIAEQEFSRSAQEAEEFVAQFADKTPASSGLGLHDVLSRVPALAGNEVEILLDGQETFPSMLDGIASAQEYILIQFFIIRDDEIGRRFQQLLMDKARQGVAVYLLYDEIGSLRLPDSYLNELRAAGVEVSSFNSSQGLKARFQLNFRNHRKILVVDGDVAWLGGLNLGDEYLGKDPDYGKWRDTHLRIAGPAALPAQLIFLEDWHWATDNVLKLNWEAPESTSGEVPVQIIPSGPADQQSKAQLLYLQAISRAQERLWIASPYFVPDGAILAALELAALRGVDVKIIIGDDPSERLAYYAAHTYLQELGYSEVEVFMYESGYMHEKVLLKDNDTAIIGTVNLDYRSLYLNFEISALIEHEGFAGKVEQMLEKDLAHSRLLPDDIFAEKPFWFRVAASVSRLAAPLL